MPDRKEKLGYAPLILTLSQRGRIDHVGPHVVPDKLPWRVVRIHRHLNIGNVLLNRLEQVELSLGSLLRDSAHLSVELLLVENLGGAAAASACQGEEPLTLSCLAGECAQT